jgi:hypothetical protein
MPTLLYDLELTEEELFHLFALLSMRELKMGPTDHQEISILKKIEELVEQW